MENGRIPAAIVLVGMLVALGGCFAVVSYEQVPEGHKGVEKQWGAVSGNVINPGAHWRIPVRDTIQMVEIRERTYSMRGEDSIEVKSANGTRHEVDVTIRYHVDEQEVDSFVSQWGDLGTAEQRIIRPTVRSTLRDEGSAQFSTTIFTQDGRERLEEAVTEALREDFDGKALVLDAVQIRQVSIESQALQDELNSREQAKIAEERARREVEVARQEKRQREIEAQADAEVIRIKGQALRDNPEVLIDRYIEALRNGNTIYVPTGSGDEGGVIPTFDIGQNIGNGNTTTGNTTATP